jgi:hypothetical protein
MTNNDDSFEEFPSLCPPVIATAATRRRRHRPPHVDQGFLSVSPKKVPIADTSDTAVALAVGDDRRRGGEGGRGGERGGGLHRRRRAGGTGWRAKGAGGGRPTQQVSFFSSHMTHLYHAASLRTTTPYTLDASDSGGGYVNGTLARRHSGCEDTALVLPNKHQSHILYGSCPTTRYQTY